MMKLILPLFLLAIFSCTKKENTNSFIGTINIDIQTNNVNFAIEKVHNLTDSIYFSFATIDSNYNCDKYRINIATEKNENNINITLGNIYRDGGFCIYGFYPAIAKYKNQKLALGKYKLFVKNNTTNKEGTLDVTSSSYQITWEHDASLMKINPKYLQK